MAGSVNKVTLIGNLGRDPEIRSLQNGSKVANLALATSETWKDRDSGERRERTEWHRITIFAEGLVGVAEKYLQKGSQIYVEGSLQTRKWQDQEGQDRYSTEIVVSPYRGTLVMLGSSQGGGAAADSGRTGSRNGAGQRGSAEPADQDQAGQEPGGMYSDGQKGQSWDDMDDEIPF